MILSFVQLDPCQTNTATRVGRKTLSLILENHRLLQRIGDRARLGLEGEELLAVFNGSDGDVVVGDSENVVVAVKDDVI